MTEHNLTLFDLADPGLVQEPVQPAIQPTAAQRLVMNRNTAEQLSRAFGTAPELWLTIHESARAAILAGGKYTPAQT